MTEEMETFYERLSFCFETRKYADLRILLLDMEPVDIAHYLDPANSNVEVKFLETDVPTL